MNASQRCHGQEDEKGHPTCTGGDVRLVHARAPEETQMFTTYWCAECRDLARGQGYVIKLILPVARGT